MNTALSGILAIELRPHSPAAWIATYYPVLDTAAGRVVDINLVLHEQLLPTEHELEGPATWLEADSPRASAPCYADHRTWAAQLAAGYDRALDVYDNETVDEQSSIENPEAVRAATVLVDSAQHARTVTAESFDVPEKHLLGRFALPTGTGFTRDLAHTASFCRD
jgi:hypothetical protein